MEETLVDVSTRSSAPDSVLVWIVQPFVTFVHLDTGSDSSAKSNMLQHNLVSPMWRLQVACTSGPALRMSF